MGLFSAGTSSSAASAGRLQGDDARLAALGASSGFGAEALGRERAAMASARGEAALAQQSMAAGGANPFAAQREAQRGLASAQGSIRQQTAEQLGQMAMVERQRQEAERLRRQGEARQMMGGLLSTGGAVLGSVMGPMGGGLGGGIGSAVGGMIPGGAPQGQAMAGQTPTQGLAPSVAMSQPPMPQRARGFAGFGMGGGLGGMLDPRFLFGGR